MDYSVSIDVPSLEDGVTFYSQALGFQEQARPIASYAVLQHGDCEIGIFEKPAGSVPAKGTKDVRRYERHWTPVHIDFHVDDFEKTVAQAIAAGGICEDKFDDGEHPAVAFFSDPFGNGFCIIAAKDEA